MSSASGESLKKINEADIAASNTQNMQIESQKPAENAEKMKPKPSTESQGNCYW